MVSLINSTIICTIIMMRWKWSLVIREEWRVKSLLSLMHGKFLIFLNLQYLLGSKRRGRTGAMIVSAITICQLIFIIGLCLCCWQAGMDPFKRNRRLPQPYIPPDVLAMKVSFPIVIRLEKYHSMGPSILGALPSWVGGGGGAPPVLPGE